MDSVPWLEFFHAFPSEASPRIHWQYYAESYWARIVCPAGVRRPPRRYGNDQKSASWIAVPSLQVSAETSICLNDLSPAASFSVAPRDRATRSVPMCMERCIYVGQGIVSLSHSSLHVAGSLSPRPVVSAKGHPSVQSYSVTAIQCTFSLFLRNRGIS